MYIATLNNYALLPLNKITLFDQPNSYSVIYKLFSIEKKGNKIIQGFFATKTPGGELNFCKRILAINYMHK